MKISVKAAVDPQAILERRGMGRSNKLRKYLAGRVKAHCDPYVPMKSGVLKNTAAISTDGSELTYNTPYAHYQYHGMAMAGRAPKHYTGKALHHRGAPMRGPQWEKRMVADRRSVLEDEIATFINENGG